MPPIRSDILHPDRRDAGEIVDPRRLRREHTRWPGLDQATRFARIVVLDHGGRRRPVIHRGSRHLRSRVVSRKTDLLQISEGKGLRFLIQRCEIDGNKVDYQAHPFRIDVVADGEVLTWYPDIVWVERGGRPHLVEVKTDISALDDPDYLRKIQIMLEVARLIGWTLQVVYDEDIFGRREIRDARWANVNAIYSRRYLLASDYEKHALSTLVAHGGEIEWKTAREAVAPGDAARGDAVVEWAIARGRFTADLDSRITPRTVLTPLHAAAATATIRI
ncbi:hypothetical protein [Sphingomonas sp. CROZ-RG-20F-R02-07]|uniref:hypothetical protein n=1 Tax=Sphingomonas sp. CROZ-RG-20F-R02-07 TaxID=2914832 RepID=UPI001F5A4940|nr:hypothetical protein [Sphingomonas sp. CROZ-RG-20F-R02-07]